MVKKLRYVMLSLMAMLCGSLWAQTVTIDFDNNYATLFPTLAGTSSSDSHDGDFTESTTSTPVEGVTVTVSAKISGSNENRIWSGAPRLRMYTGTFTVTGADITKIEFTANSNFNLSTTTGTLDGKTWTGKADEIVFDVAKNTQINKIVVTLGEGGGNAGDNDDPELPAGGTETEPWTVAEALAACANLGADEYVNDGAEVYVAGVITKIDEISTGYGNATYYISDDVEGSNSLEVYRGNSLNGDKFTSATEIEVGDSVIVCGKIVNFRGNTLEFTTGSKLVSLKKGEGNGNAGDEPTEPGETGTIDNPLTPSQAYDLVSAMPADQTSTADYYVKGKICSIKYTFSAQYGTATFNISDDGNASDKEFTAYSCLYFNNQKWQEGDAQVNVGDEVIVCGKVVNYYGNTPEFASQKNCLVSLNGTVTAINGTKTSAQSAQTYNMAGQKVTDNYRGLVVKNGKKVMMK